MNVNEWMNEWMLSLTILEKGTENCLLKAEEEPSHSTLYQWWTFVYIAIQPHYHHKIILFSLTLVQWGFQFTTLEDVCERTGVFCMHTIVWLQAWWDNSFFKWVNPHAVRRVRAAAMCTQPESQWVKSLAHKVVRNSLCHQVLATCNPIWAVRMCSPPRPAGVWVLLPPTDTAASPGDLHTLTPGGMSELWVRCVVPQRKRITAHLSGAGMREVNFIDST